MDNLKSFLGTVMTTTSSSATNRNAQPTASSSKGTSENIGGAAGDSFVAKAPAQDATKLKVSNSPTIGGGRYRSESESSVASDISITTEMGGALGREQRSAGVKRKDSEPYFWIM